MADKRPSHANCFMSPEIYIVKQLQKPFIAQAMYEGGTEALHVRQQLAIHVAAVSDILQALTVDREWTPLSVRLLLVHLVRLLWPTLEGKMPPQAATAASRTSSTPVASSFR